MMRIGGPEFLFMSEAEGFPNLVNTHTAKINAVARDLRECYLKGTDPNLMRDCILNKYGLTTYDVTPQDARRINEIVFR